MKENYCFSVFIFINDAKESTKSVINQLNSEDGLIMTQGRDKLDNWEIPQ